MPEDGINKKYHDDILRFEDVEKIITESSKLGVKKVRFTGGEPLILKGIESLIKYTSSIETIEDVGITTNGILLSDMAYDLKKSGLNRVNISLDTLKSDRFKAITRVGNIKDVENAIEKCLSLNMMPLKINTVLMRGVNDDEIEDFINLTKELPIQVRFIELMPIGEGSKYFEKCFMSVEEIIDMYPKLKPIKDKSKVASVYTLPNSKGSVGFIRPMSCKFCNDCNRIRLTSSGTLKPCLHSAEEINLKPFLNDEKALMNAIKNAIYNKPEEHHLETDKMSSTDRMMFQIGG
jgi:cyclic pyranopterin phosphate synthase